DHAPGGEAGFVANRQDRLNEGGVANGRSVNVQAFAFEFDSAAVTDFRGGLLDFAQSSVARGKLRIAQVDFEPGAARDAVDGTRFDTEDAGGSDGVRAAGI